MPGCSLLTLLGGVAVQTGTNMLNTYGDYRSGVDTEASAHGESPILLAPYQPRSHAAGAASSPCAWPLPWASCSGSPAAGRYPLAFGLVGIRGRLRLHQRLLAFNKYHACGPIMVFLLMRAAHGALPASTTSREAPLTGRPFSRLPAYCVPRHQHHARQRHPRHRARPRGRDHDSRHVAERRRESPVPVTRPLCVGAYGVLLLSRRIRRLAALSGLVAFRARAGIVAYAADARDPASCPESELVSLDGVSARHHFLFGAAAHCRNTACPAGP